MRVMRCAPNNLPQAVVTTIFISMSKWKARCEITKSRAKQKASQDEGGQSDINMQMPVEGTSGVLPSLPAGPFSTQQSSDTSLEAASGAGVELVDPSYPQSELVQDIHSKDQHMQLDKQLPTFGPAKNGALCAHDCSAPQGTCR
jgi:hypothetical protein